MPTSKLVDILAPPTTCKETLGVEVLIPILLLVASTKKVLEILAVIPELEAISKNVSGVLSPSPNLPDDLDEKMAKELEPSL